MAQIVSQQRGRSITSPQLLLQTFQADRLEVAVDRRVQLARWGRLLVDHLPKGLHRRGRLKRRPRGQYVVQRRPQRVDVGQGRYVGRIPSLLRRHVRGRAHHFAGLGQLLLSLGQLRHAKIGHQRAIRLPVHENVLRLQVAMQNPMDVGLMHSSGDRLQIGGRLAIRDRPVTKHLGQRTAFDILHREKLLVVDLTDLVNRNDVVVFQPGRRLGLVPKTIHRTGLRVAWKRLQPVGAEYLQGHDSARRALPRAIHHPHPASPDLLQHVVVAENARLSRRTNRIVRLARDSGAGRQGFVHLSAVQRQHKLQRLVGKLDVRKTPPILVAQNVFARFLSQGILVVHEPTHHLRPVESWEPL